MGNDGLVRWGIREEQADYRIHVGYVAKVVFVFAVSEALRCLDAKEKEYETFAAGQQCVKGITGRGYKVPPNDIRGCEEIEIPNWILDLYPCGEAAGTSEKGRVAAEIVYAMSRAGWLRWNDLEPVTDRAMQRQGIDFVSPSTGETVQVKFNKWAPHYGLKIQVRERNPNKQY